MEPTPELTPAANRMKALSDGTSSGQLPDPTPCADYSVGDLLIHVMQLSAAFRNAADHTASVVDGSVPEPSAANLPTNWRAHLAQRLDDLAAAWNAPEAWEGVTAAGGLELPAPQAGVIALNELVLHGWDLARATGQPYECDLESAEACFAFVSRVPTDDPQARAGLFGPVVDVPEDASLFNRLLGLSGRDPSWGR